MKKTITLSIFILMCAFIAQTTHAVVAPTTCTDGLDNNFNTLIDEQDSEECPIVVEETEEIVVTESVENTLAYCTDGLDNNYNTLIDEQEPDCDPILHPVVATTTATTSTPVDTNTYQTYGPTYGGGGGSSYSGGFSGGITSGTPISAAATSTSVSTSTASTTEPASCPNPFTTYMKYGKKNNAAEVSRLQAFLNANLGINIPVTGFFGTQTLAAVKNFQLKYADTILKPWIDAGISTNGFIATPTGYVYKTTLRQINALVCPSYDIAMPILK